MTKSQRITLSTATVLAALAALTLGACADPAATATPVPEHHGSGTAMSADTATFSTGPTRA